MGSDNNKKTDRRVLYTKKIIKDTLVEELNKKKFHEISITSVCKKADISRTTFYLHYKNLIEVVEDMVDDLIDYWPPFFKCVIEIYKECDDVGESKKIYTDYSNIETITKGLSYKSIFKDSNLLVVILNRINIKRKDTITCFLAKELEIDKKRAEAIYYFQINGFIAAAINMECDSAQDWIEFQETIDILFGGGFREIKKFFSKKNEKK